MNEASEILRFVRAFGVRAGRGADSNVVLVWIDGDDEEPVPVRSMDEARELFLDYRRDDHDEA